jgi:hypothetical protein
MPSPSSSARATLGFLEILRFADVAVAIVPVLPNSAC